MIPAEESERSSYNPRLSTESRMSDTTRGKEERMFAECRGHYSVLVVVATPSMYKETVSTKKYDLCEAVEIAFSLAHEAEDADKKKSNRKRKSNHHEDERGMS